MLEAGEAIAQCRLHTGFLVSAARYPDRVALSIGEATMDNRDPFRARLGLAA